MRKFSLRQSIVVISDFVDHDAPASAGCSASSASWMTGGAESAIDDDTSLKQRDRLAVAGSYLERLPLAAIRAGHADRAEIWQWGPAGSSAPLQSDNHFIGRRRFGLDDTQSPFHSSDALAFLHAFGPPAILCVWGLGVSEALLAACSDSFIVYNSIDAPALRVPDALARHFDLILTAAQWQSEEIRRRLPDIPTEILPIGPEFASPDMFRPLPVEKDYDIVYVAAAQPYKRHDILFDALQRSPRPLKALCVIGYGELGEALRSEAAARGLDIDFVGPPGVAYDEVNRLMNRARIGVVCGIEDGAPAILTEYMLAGLPVVANSRLRCGLHYITPETGVVAEPETFEAGLLEALGRLETFAPRRTVIDRWSWPRSIARLAPYFALRDGIAIKNTAFG